MPILKGLGFGADGLCCDPDGPVPNHHSDPTDPENLVGLSGRVREIVAGVGILDCDAETTASTLAAVSHACRTPGPCS
jgi:hypothetical protein